MAAMLEWQSASIQKRKMGGIVESLSGDIQKEEKLWASRPRGRALQILSVQGTWTLLGGGIRAKPIFVDRNAFSME
jgi:hypothetical protein